MKLLYDCLYLIQLHYYTYIDFFSGVFLIIQQIGKY